MSTKRADLVRTKDRPPPCPVIYKMTEFWEVSENGIRSMLMELVDDVTHVKAEPVLWFVFVSNLKNIY